MGWLVIVQAQVAGQKGAHSNGNATASHADGAGSVLDWAGQHEKGRAANDPYHENDRTS